MKLLFLISITWLVAANAEVEFKFKRAMKACVNSNGVVGYNSTTDFLECTQHNEKILVGKDLSNRNLRGSDFTAANLARVNLQNSDIRGVKLSDANLANANLSGAVYDDTTTMDVTDADASKMGMKKFDWNQVDYYLTTASEAYLKGTGLLVDVEALLLQEADPANMRLDEGLIVSAFKAEKFDLFNLFIAHGFKFDRRTDNVSELVAAINSKSINALKLVLENGGNTEFEDTYIKRPKLYWELERNRIDPDQLEILLPYWNLNKPTKDCKTAIFFARSLPVAKRMVEAGALIPPASCVPEHKNRLFAEFGKSSSETKDFNREWVDILIKAGETPSGTMKLFLGSTFTWNFNLSRLEMIKILYDAGDRDIDAGDSDFSFVNHIFWRLLYFYQKKYIKDYFEFEGLAEFFVQKGADPTLFIEQFVEIPSEHRLEFTKKLISWGAKANIGPNSLLNKLMRSHQTPNFIDELKFAVSVTTDFGQADTDGILPIRRCETTECIGILYSAGADPFATDKAGSVFVARLKDPTAVQFYLDNHIPVDFNKPISINATYSAPVAMAMLLNANDSYPKTPDDFLAFFVKNESLIDWKSTDSIGRGWLDALIFSYPYVLKDLRFEELLKFVISRAGPSQFDQHKFLQCQNELIYELRMDNYYGFHTYLNFAWKMDHGVWTPGAYRITFNQSKEGAGTFSFPTWWKDARDRDRSVTVKFSDFKSAQLFDDRNDLIAKCEFLKTKPKAMAGHLISGRVSIRTTGEVAPKKVWAYGWADTHVVTDPKLNDFYVWKNGDSYFALEKLAVDKTDITKKYKGAYVSDVSKIDQLLEDYRVEF